MNSTNRFIRRQPSLSFVLLAYGFSWTVWIVALLLPKNILSACLYYLGSFGPLVAAIVVLKSQRRSLWAWFKNLFKWRYSLGWYVFVLGFPILLIAIVSLIYGLLGHSLYFSLLPGRLVAYLPMLVFLALAGGGNEEPGWRGLWLPMLQTRYRHKRYGTVAATTLLGAVWAFWHVPILAANPDVASGAISPGEVLFVAGVTLVSIMTHAFWYTWLMNRTGSVLLCSLFHASYNAANGLLLLVPEQALRGSTYQFVLVLMTTVLVASVVGLLLATRGRLGTTPPQSSNYILSR